MHLKRNTILNIIMGSSVGVFIGHLASEYFQYKKFSELHAVQSAPWYVSSVIYGLVSVLIIITLSIVKINLNKKQKNRFSKNKH